MSRVPRVTLARSSVHASLDQAKVRGLVLARPVALPDVCSVAVDFIVKGVVYGDLIVAVVVYGVCEQLEANAMSSSIISARVLPRGGDKEVGMNRLVEQGVDGVGAWTVLQQRCRQLQTDARELSGLGVLG
jgi:hypothetical protein